MDGLRDYQKKTIEMLYDWMSKNKGNPCVVLPTGSGKSHVIAGLCKDALIKWPKTRILMLTHVKELIEQNAKKMREHWRNAPLGIYSASAGQRDVGEQITFAGIQSVRNRVDQIGFIDLCIVDECHLISHKQEGSYRNLINNLILINPSMRVVGFTATPQRLGHGLITDKPAIFDSLIKPIGLEDLILQGYLSILRSKTTRLKINTKDVKKRDGEYIDSDLKKVVDTKDNNEKVINEIINLAEGRKKWLFFCCGIDHAQKISKLLNDKGINAGCITSKTSKRDRRKIIDSFESGKIRALTNANVLTTGFDCPNIDLIVMLRPTMSVGLYIQMLGRGLRLKEHINDCLVLDFVGVVSMHGPLVGMQDPDKKVKSKNSGDAPIKICESCHEICHAAVKQCPACKNMFPEPKRKKLELRNDDVMGIEASDFKVTAWEWRRHTSKTSGKDMICVSYYGSLSKKPIVEYFPILHEGYAGDKAIRNVLSIAKNCGVSLTSSNDDYLNNIPVLLNGSKPPYLIEYKQDGKFYRVINRIWL